MSTTATRDAAEPTRATAPAVSDARFRRRHGRRRAAADLLGIIVWASAAMAITLWLASGTVTAASVGEIVTDAGIIAGLVGTDLVLVMLVLAARIPVIDRLVGHDAAMSQHGRLGKPALYLLLGHAVLLIIGYGLETNTNAVIEAVDMWNSPDMPLAIIGIGLFIAVVWTSISAARRVFPYEVWHLIHLLSYVAVAFAIPHQLSEGEALAAGSWERVYWIALYVVAFGSIALFRFAVPIVRSIRHGVVVDRVEPLADDVVSIHLRGRDLGRLRARGGQFLMWRFWAGGTWWHAHPLSLSAAPTDTTMRITVRALGRGSAGLAHLRHGTPVSFAGPYGVFTDATRTSTRVAVAASGIGVTPVRAFLEELDAPPGAVTILLRARSEREAFLWGEISEWARTRGHRMFVSIGQRGLGPGGWLAAEDAARGASAASIFPDLAHSDLYVCGPQAWGDLVARDAARAGLVPDRLHRERFDW